MLPNFRSGAVAVTLAWWILYKSTVVCAQKKVEFQTFTDSTCTKTVDMEHAKMTFTQDAKDKHCWSGNGLALKLTCNGDKADVLMYFDKDESGNPVKCEGATQSSKEGFNMDGLDKKDVYAFLTAGKCMIMPPSVYMQSDPSCNEEAACKNQHGKLSAPMGADGFPAACDPATGGTAPASEGTDSVAATDEVSVPFTFNISGLDLADVSNDDQNDLKTEIKTTLAEVAGVSPDKVKITFKEGSIVVNAEIETADPEAVQSKMAEDDTATAITKMVKESPILLKLALDKGLTDADLSATQVVYSNPGGTLVAGCDPKAPAKPCCQRIGHEINLACKEMHQIATSEETCQVWVNAGVQACNLNCGDCATITKAVWDQCYFALQSELNDLRLSQDYCDQMRESMEFGRCPSLCDLERSTQCVNLNAETGEPTKFPACNALCGNFRYCDCYRELQKFGQPDVCEGDTVLEGQVAGMPPGIIHSCGLIPQDCKNHIFGTKCGHLKYCQPDLCVVLNKTCPKFDSCQQTGFCLPATGQCSYTYKPDTAMCDDAKYWTYNDRCYDGRCVGQEDLCIKEEVTCKTHNPCLVEDGVCTPETGWCTYTQKEDGTPCSDSQGKGRMHIHNAACQSGLCRGTRIHDVCMFYNITCTVKDKVCNRPGTCNPETGECSRPRLIEGRSCNDGDPLTKNDRCIEGRCIGDLWAEPKFKTLGQGHCVDARSNPDAQYILPRYYKDVLERKDCEEQCRKDVQCTAYSYGYYVCSIYGRMRTQPPHSDFWGSYGADKEWSFEPAYVGKPSWIVEEWPFEAHAPVAVRKLREREAETYCYVRGDVEDIEEENQLMKILALVFVTFFVIVFPSVVLFAPLPKTRLSCSCRCCPKKIQKEIKKVESTVVMSGDEIYIRTTTVNDLYLEVGEHAGEGLMGSTRSFGEGERRLHGLEDLPHIQHVNTIAIRSNRHSAKYGYGIRLSFQDETKSSNAKFKIYKWTGPIASGAGAQIGGGPGPIYSGDTVYLQAMGVNHYVEVLDHADGGYGGGYGLSTRPTKSANAEFKVYKWTGGEGPIFSGDNVYIQAMAVNHYVEMHGHDEPGGGYGVSTVPCTRGATEATVQFNIEKIFSSIGNEPSPAWPEQLENSVQNQVVPFEGVHQSPREAQFPHELPGEGQRDPEKAKKNGEKTSFRDKLPGCTPGCCSRGSSEGKEKKKKEEKKSLTPTYPDSEGEGGAPPAPDVTVPNGERPSSGEQRLMVRTPSYPSSD